MINDFLKEYYELCKKHNTELVINKEYELEAQDITTGNALAKDVNVWFNLKEINYTDSENTDIELKVD